LHISGSVEDIHARHSKLPSNATVDRGGGKLGIGMVVRNFIGKFLAALACGLPTVMDPNCVEAYGVWKLDEFCSREG
jgi:hypothetical protein